MDSITGAMGDMKSKMDEAYEEADTYENPFKKIAMEMVQPLEDSDEEKELEEGQKALDERLNHVYPESGVDCWTVEDLPSFWKEADMFGLENNRKKKQMKFGISSQMTGDDFREN